MRRLSFWLPIMLLLACNTTRPITASASGIEFVNGSWQQMLNMAKDQQQLVFVDAFTEWCGPCKMMERNVFSADDVGAFFNGNFVNYRLDMEKGEGLAFAERYQVDKYPTLLFINHRGELVHQAFGYLAPVRLLSEAQKALSPEKNQSLLELKYEAGSQDPEVLFSYAMNLKVTEKDYAEAAKRYFDTQEEKTLLQDQNWDAIQAFTTDLNSREYRYLLDRQKKFMKRYGTQEVADKIYGVLKSNVIRAAFLRDRNLLQEALDVANEEIRDDGRTASRLRMVYAEATKDWADYAFKTELHFDKYLITSPKELDNAARHFYDEIDDAAKLEKAVEWARQSAAIENAYYNNATLALLLAKLGRAGEARSQAYKTLKLVPLDKPEQGKEMETLIQKLGG